jgi:HEAT repeat protein
MAFYELDKTSRQALVDHIHKELLSSIQKQESHFLKVYFGDEDAYIRKTAYLAIGKIYAHSPELRSTILPLLFNLFTSQDQKIRQTTVNAAGEIGKNDFAPIEQIMEQGLFDKDPTVRNAVIGSLKKMGEKNPLPTLVFARCFLHHEDKEIRREICHGIELRGRTHPQDILPLLKELEFDKTARVRTTLVHVLGQISYKKGCLATVIAHLKTWENEEVVKKAMDEIVDVHRRYAKFAALSQAEAVALIAKNF